MRRAHEHKPGEWCNECALAADVAELARYDYPSQSWYLDGLTSFRTDLYPGSDTSPVPQGTWWLIDRIAWNYLNGSPTIALTAIPRVGTNSDEIVCPLTVPMLTSTDGFVSQSVGVHEFESSYQLAPGRTLRILDPENSLIVQVDYRVRTIVPAPSETRKRLFFTPVITPPDGGEPVSDTTSPTPKKPIVTELDPTAFKASGV